VTAMICPDRTAREMPTFGSKGDPVETCWRWLLTIAPTSKSYRPKVANVSTGWLQKLYCSFTYSAFRLPLVTDDSDS
jgi:hypothetical protein